MGWSEGSGGLEEIGEGRVEVEVEGGSGGRAAPLVVGSRYLAGLDCPPHCELPTTGILPHRDSCRGAVI